MERPFAKLGLAGASSTGKTSLVARVRDALQRSGHEVGVVGGIGAEAERIGFSVRQGHTFESTLWIMSRCISEELRVGRGVDVLLVDRPVMDAIGWFLAALERRGEAPKSEQLSYLFDLARHHALTYDILCNTVLDPGVTLADGRDPDLVFRTSVDRLTMSMFGRLGLTPAEIRYSTDSSLQLSARIEDLVAQRR